MIKNIIREVEPEAAELSFYFDGDCYRDYDGEHFNQNLFILSYGYMRRIESGFNLKDYKLTQEQAEAVIDGFNDVTDELTTYDGDPITFDMVLSDEGISTDKRDDLIKWYKADPDINNTDDIAKFLSITTGEHWTTISVNGYSQGDYCEVVFCESCYTEPQAYSAGQVWLGCAKEFCVIDAADPDAFTCYGFIVADSEARDDEDYKRIVCEWAGIDPEETRLEMIDYTKPPITRTIYSYRTIDPEPVTVSATLPKAAHASTTPKY